MNATMIRRTASLLASTALVLTMFVGQQAAAQDAVPAPDPRPSPLALSQVTLDDGAYVKIHYSSPRMRGREIFGGLVPYGHVWRFGANEATELTVTQSITIGGQEVEAGTYAVFAIPGENEWTIILNRNLGQWGAFSYAEDADYARITVPAEEVDASHEAFSINLEENEGASGANMVVAWETTRLSIPIEPED